MHTHLHKVKSGGEHDDIFAKLRGTIIQNVKKKNKKKTMTVL